MANNKPKKKTRKELQAEFASLVSLKEYAECQVRKVAGTGAINEKKAAEYLATVEKALTETGALL